MTPSACSKTGPGDDDDKEKKEDENGEEEPGPMAGEYAQPDLDIGEGDEVPNRAQ
jgi:hypothetical protein